MTDLDKVCYSMYLSYLTNRDSITTLAKKKRMSTNDLATILTRGKEIHSKGA
jgi:hypothetical protein